MKIHYVQAVGPSDESVILDEEILNCGSLLLNKIVIIFRREGINF
jgi:hypothetical protein